MSDTSAAELVERDQVPVRRGRPVGAEPASLIGLRLRLVLLRHDRRSRRGIGGHGGYLRVSRYLVMLRRAVRCCS